MRVTLLIPQRPALRGG